jgi:hypothetical protein
MIPPEGQDLYVKVRREPETQVPINLCFIIMSSSLLRVSKKKSGKQLFLSFSRINWLALLLILFIVN